jgi:hypothetical protein
VSRGRVCYRIPTLMMTALHVYNSGSGELRFTTHVLPAHKQHTMPTFTLHVTWSTRLQSGYALKSDSHSYYEPIPLDTGRMYTTETLRTICEDLEIDCVHTFECTRENSWIYHRGALRTTRLSFVRCTDIIGRRATTHSSLPLRCLSSYTPFCFPVYWYRQAQKDLTTILALETLFTPDFS